MTQNYSPHKQKSSHVGETNTEVTRAGNMLGGAEQTTLEGGGIQEELHGITTH